MTALVEKPSGSGGLREFGPQREGLARQPRYAYLRAMPLPRPASPRALWADLRAFATQRSPHQWVAAVLAILMPLVIVIGFYFDAQTNIMPGEQIVYVESWSENRTDEEILEAQKVRQERQEAMAAERQRQFKELEKRLGM